MRKNATQPVLTTTLLLSGSLILASATALNSCCLPVRNSQMKPVDVNVQRFMLLYDAPRRRTMNLQYAGIRKGYHYIDLYQDVGISDIGCVTHVRSYRVADAELPDDFPDHPQQRFSEAWSDEDVIAFNAATSPIGER